MAADREVYRLGVQTSERTRAGFWHTGRLTPRQVDWLMVGAATLLSLPAFPRLVQQGVGSTRFAIAVALVPFGTLPLLWRRSHPAATLVALSAAFCVSAAFGAIDPSAPGLLFGVGSAALYGDKRTRLAAAALGILVLASAFGLVLATGNARALGYLAGPAFGVGLAWVIGDRMRNRRAYLAELEDRASSLEREREADAAHAAEEERMRIARELHDVVAHNVSVIAVQAGASRMAPDESRDDLAATLSLIEGTARSTLAELRAVLSVLRHEENSPPSRTPQPTMTRLDQLVEHAKGSGARIQVRVEGDVRTLPSAIDLSAYRIVQEALTNVLKHAPGATVEVRVHHGARDLLVAVRDDGPGGRANGSRGHGIIGMRERAALVGGTLDVGPAPGGGFQVEARLPIPKELETTEPAPALPFAPDLS